jgi:hypothetical protein
MPSLLPLPAAARSRVTCSGTHISTRRLLIARSAGAALPRAHGVATPFAGRFSPSHLRLQVRGKKTKTTVSFDALPQGPLPGPELPQGPLPAPDGASDEPLLEEESGPAYPTVVMQARRNMNKYDNCVLLTRVGGFYELYFEHAEEYGPLLNLKVAQKKTGAGPVPMVI